MNRFKIFYTLFIYRVELEIPTCLSTGNFHSRGSTRALNVNEEPSKL